MSKKAAQEIVMDALRGIEHPEMPEINLVELEMIQGIKINDSIVEVNLALPKLCISIKSQLVASIQQAIQGTEENLEVTGILAVDFVDKAMEFGLTASELERAKELIGQVSIIPEAHTLADHGATAMHDVTRGGLVIGNSV